MPNPSWRERQAHPAEVNHSPAHLPFVFKIKEDSIQDPGSVTCHLTLTSRVNEAEVLVRCYWGIEMLHLYNLIHSTWDELLFLLQSETESSLSAEENDSKYLATSTVRLKEYESATYLFEGSLSCFSTAQLFESSAIISLKILFYFSTFFSEYNGPRLKLETQTN